MATTTESEVRTAPYGTWESPISAKSLAAGDTTLLQIAPTAQDFQSDNESDRRIYFIDARPQEQGRCCIVECRLAANGSSQIRDVLPSEYSAKTSVHGYGGGPFVVLHNGNLAFSDAKSHGIYSLDPHTGKLDCLVRGDKDIFFADFDAGGKTLQRWLLAIREDHHSQPAINTIVAIDMETRVVHTIVSGSDFYSHPRLHTSRSGKSVLCWEQWGHPDMPWTGSQLFVASLDDGFVSHEREPKLREIKCVAGHPGIESIACPRWNRYDDSLLFCSDSSGYWQLQKLPWGHDRPVNVQLQGLEDGDFARPEWSLGSSSFTILDRDTIAAMWIKTGVTRLVLVDLENSSGKLLPQKSIDNRWPSIERISDTEYVVTGSTTDAPLALYQGSIVGGTDLKLLKSSSNLSISDAYCSEMKPISFKQTGEGKVGNTSFGMLMMPKNPHFVGPANTLPPLIVYMHGGPTSHVGPGLNMAWQYWTTRGYAFAAVNYSGSSGYSRAYRDRLDGEWGLVDVADAADCVKHLVSSGVVDGSRVGITGVSAGGYACLQALCSFPDVFAGGVSICGVSDVAALARDTHKFESHYMDRLLWGTEGNPSKEEKEEIFRARSPLYHADKIRAALLLLQGSDDEIVPANQAQAMRDSIKKRHGDAEVVIFEGEGHMFTKAATIERTITDAEQWWRKTLVH